MFDEVDEDGLTALPATMSDILFALVAVVIVILLSLAPALRLPGALASRKADLLSSPILIEGRPAQVFVAEAGGLRVEEDEGRVVPPDAILDDPGLAERLRAIDSAVLLIVTEEGQEAAFLFNSLAGTQGITSIRQVRIDPLCGHVVDRARVGCAPSGAAT